jgi:hypothetical protein
MKCKERLFAKDKRCAKGGLIIYISESKFGISVQPYATQLGHLVIDFRARTHTYATWQRG